MTGTADPGSFRDPAGFVFRRGGILYRQVNQSYAGTLSRLEQSGFLEGLQRDGLLVAHERLGPDQGATADALAVWRPDMIPFISYPYEWCFGQLRDAALLTLELQQRALDAGFILRDASAYNVQFLGGFPIFIDSLSFGQYVDGQPWQAYGQFCEHFLAPLALMTEHDARLAGLQQSFSDGIPLEIASRLLGPKTWLRSGLLLHIHGHAKSRRRYAHDSAKQRARTLPLASLRRLIAHLRETIEGMRLDPAGTPWADYETEHSYSTDATAQKREIVQTMLARLGAEAVWDLGANTGMFSALAPPHTRVIAIDGDHAAVERHYQRVRRKNRCILPLVMDLSNPSPARGWAHAERKSLAERGPADVVLALALLHHLVLRAGVPLGSVARWLSELTRFAVVEFVPPDDEQALRLVAGRMEQTHPYSELEFRRAFGAHFVLHQTVPIEGSKRVLYLCQTRSALDEQSI